MPSLLTSLRALPRAAWILFGGTFINRFGTFLMPFLAIYMTRQGYSTAQAGIAVSAYGAGHIVASIAGGHLADRIGRRNTIAISMLLSALSMIALSQVHTLPLILLFAFIVGAVGELYRPAATALLGDLVPPENRVPAFAMYRFAVNLGFAMGPAVAGFLADKSFVYLFVGDAITSFVYFLVAIAALPHGVRSSSKDEKPAEALRYAFADRAFMTFLAATLCLTWIEFQLHSTYPLYLTHAGYSTKTYGLLLSVNGAMVVLFELALTTWTQRRPPQPLIALGYGLSGGGMALVGLAGGMPVLVISMMIMTVGEMIYAPVSGAYVAGLAPERFRGRYMGLWHLTWSAGMLLGPLLGTLIYEKSAAALWITCAILGAAATVLALVKTKESASVRSELAA